MLLDTLSLITFDTPTQFVFTVPGDRYWNVRTIIASASTDAGGAPDRAYLLTVATSTGPVAIVGAPNPAGDSGTDTITWANIPASSVVSGSTGVAVVPLVLPTLYPGYTITGDITNPAGADTWISALVWYEYALTSSP